MEHDGSLLCSCRTANNPHPEEDESCKQYLTLSYPLIYVLFIPIVVFRKRNLCELLSYEE
jgi:hypothetical protein